MTRDPNNLFATPRNLAAFSAWPECASDDYAMMSQSDKETLKIGRGKPGPGRPPGLPNKATRALKAVILDAFEKVGGEEYLVRVAREDPKTFCILLGKILPTQLAGDPNDPIKTISRIEVVLVRPGDQINRVSEPIKARVHALDHSGS